MKLKDFRTVVKGQFAVKEEVIDAMENFLLRQSGNFTSGRTDFEGGIYANAETYTTKKASKFEYHKKMVDIQVLIKGHEVILYGMSDKVEEVVPYSTDKDIAFCEGTGIDRTELHTGEFCVIKPSKLHMPGMTAGDELQEVSKVVFKIPRTFLR